MVLQELKSVLEFFHSNSGRLCKSARLKSIPENMESTSFFFGSLAFFRNRQTTSREKFA